MNASLQPNRDFSLCHPKWSCQLWQFVQALEQAYTAGELKLHWKLFELYRHPDRQDWLLRQGTTRAAAWYSPHQYGLAADFVVYDAGTWKWPDDKEPYAELHALGHKHGILFPLPVWDPGHAEAAYWSQLVAFFKSPA